MAEFVLKRDATEAWRSGCRAIENTTDAMRDDLRDKGVADGEAMEAVVLAEQAKMQEELSRNIDGDFSSPYEMPDLSAIAAELREGQEAPDLGKLEGGEDGLDDALEGGEAGTEMPDIPAEGLSDAEVDAVCADIERDI